MYGCTQRGPRRAISGCSAAVVMIALALSIPATAQAVDPLQIAVSLDRVGFVDRSGVATISGTVTCNQHTVFSVSGELTQTRAHRSTVLEPGYIEGVICTPPSVPWTMTMIFAGPPDPFLPGRAEATVHAFGCTGSDCVTETTSADIRLRRQHP